MDSTKVDAQNAGDLDHSWSGDHSARNGGLWNNWIPAKTEQTMGYFTGTPVTGSAPSVQLTLANDGTMAVTYTLTANDYAGTTQTVTVGASGSASVTWPVDANGYYDVIITANTSDGFTRRYAGRIA
jgi:phospholipase C